jgi:hypothetical protein
VSTNDNSNVVVLQVETSLDLPLERVLEGARANEVSDCLLMGYDKDGQFYLAGQSCDVGKALVLMERAKRLMLRRLEEG